MYVRGDEARRRLINSESGAANSPPQRILLLAALTGLVIWLALVYIQLQLPWLGLTLAPTEAGLKVEAVAEQHPNAEAIAVGAIITALEVDAAPPFALQADDLIKEPDVLIAHGAYRAFMQRQQTLYSAYADGHVTARLADGRSVHLTAIDKPLAGIPVLFWMECVWSLTCLLVGAAVWAFRRDEASAYLLGTGIAYLVFVAGDAMYGSRELALPASLFYLFSFVNSTGAMFYPASLVSLLWVYPCRLGGRWMPVVAFVGAIVAIGASRLDGPGIGLHLLPVFILLCCGVGLVLAVLQWRKSRVDPVTHAIARWIIAILFLSVWLSAVMMTLPTLLGLRHLAPQSLLFAVFLLFYLGLALGVARYRVFDLDRWWFRAWGWFLGGLLVLLLDVLLLMLFNLGELMSLSLSLAAVGWLYFPVRQWLWTRFFQPRQSPLELALPRIIDTLFSVDNAQAIHSHWPDLLQQSFSALQVATSDQPHSEISRSHDGTRLYLPALTAQTGALEVVYPAGGSRLFTREDLQLAEVLLAWMRRALQALTAREQGADAERARIRRDLHDDLGAQLVDMAQSLPNRSSRDQAREAVVRLRAVLAAMGETGSGLHESLGRWHSEIMGRLAEVDVQCAWQVDVSTDLHLEARQHANLIRILREATTNIIRHAGATRAQYSFRQQAGVLVIVVADNGCGQADSLAGGLGIFSMRQRLEEMGGTLELSNEAEGGLRLSLRLPLAD